MRDSLEYLTLDPAVPLSWALRAIVLGALVLLIISLLSILGTLMRPTFSPLRSLKGPGNASLLLGHIRQRMASPAAGVWEQEQIAKYGHVLVYKGAFNQNRILTTDRRALNHVLTNSNTYIKGPEFRHLFSELTGKGILWQEGIGHKRQRRIMNPAFSPSHLRKMTEIFIEKAHELCQALDVAYGKDSAREWTEVDMIQYLTCTTLDIIGLAGFGYNFESITHFVQGTRTEDELSVAFRETFKHLETFSLLDLFKSYIPVLRLINFNPRSLALRKERDIVKRLSGPIVREKRKALQASGGKSDARDLLTLLIQANMREGTENAARSMTEEEVMDQIPTFLIAGHETTSIATSWTLLSLATHPDVQSRLRQELSGISSENPTMEEINNLTYLERVVRESMRYHSMISGIWRVATQNDIIPLDKPFIDKHGNMHHEIRVVKGDTVDIPSRIINNLEEIWGADARTFNPDRWLDLPEAVQGIPAAWANQLTFLAGNRACIGYRFALVEMKALLFAMLRSFEFRLAVQPEDIIGGKVTATNRPRVRSRLEKGVHLPILIKPIKRD